MRFKIQTSRIVLVPVSPAHREEIFQEFTPELTYFMTPKPPQNIGDTDTFISESEAKMEKGEEIVCAILQKDTNEFLGCAGLHRINTATPELGIWIKQSAHGHKYGQESMRALKEWADSNLSYEYIRYPVAKDNAPSRNIAESLGGELVKEIEKENNAGIKMMFVEYHIPLSKDA